MNTQWLDFLKTMGAEFEAETLLHFGNPELERKASENGLVIADLSHFSTVKATGADTETFLQGQLTNDINKVDNSHSQLSGYCNQKGRLLASFRIFRHAGDIHMQLPEALYEDTFKRLKMFVLRSDVKFTNVSADLISIGLSGPTAGKALADQFSQVPAEIDDVFEENGISVIRLAGPHPRFQLNGSLQQIKTLWQNLDVKAAPVGRDVWNLLDIRAGLPTVLPQTVEAFVPQMINLELINGVSFKKGCYTGQEIVARMHFLGKLKRRMYRIQIDTKEAMVPSTPLFSPDSTSGQGTGQIVMAAPSSSGNTYEALAVIEKSASDQTNLRLNDAEGPAITVLEIPYEFPPEKDNPAKNLKD